MYNLFLDDFRVLDDMIGPPWSNNEWVVVRSHDEFVDYITKNGLPKIVSFDHDLADEHYDYYFEHQKPIDYDEVKEKTGMHSVKWMCNYILDNDLIDQFPECHVHSANPQGKLNIESVINTFKKVYKC